MGGRYFMIMGGGQDGLGSSLAHLEPKLILFEVNDHGKDELSHDHLPNFKQL